MTEAKKEFSYPERGQLIDNSLIKKIQYAVGNITSEGPKMNVPIKNESNNSVEYKEYERPLASRVERARIYNKIKEIDNRFENVTKPKTIFEKISYKFNKLKTWVRNKLTSQNNLSGQKEELQLEQEKKEKREKIKGLLFEANQLDKISQQFVLGRHDVEVNMGNLGVQKANWVELKGATKYKETEEEKQKREDLPPVVYITGIGGGFEPGEFATELAMSGRKVVMITYPQSWLGSCTEAFCEAIKTDGFKPHTDFFESAIKQITEQLKIDKFDIYGLSTGSILAAELMKRDIGKKINRAVFISPAGMRKVGNIDNGMAMEIINRFITKFNLMPRMSVHRMTKVYKTEEERKNDYNTYLALKKWVERKYECWESQNFMIGDKKAIMIIQEKDLVVRPSKEIIKDLKDKNETLDIRVIDDGLHIDVGFMADKVIDEINKAA